MSRTIDERVVKMEFDNQRFESNVKESLSTIDKLKKSLDFDSAKSFSNIDKAANKVSFSGLLSGIETVRSKFSMLDVASYTVMSRLTNSLIDFGKKIVTAIPSQIKEGGIARAMNIEQAKFQLEGLGVAWNRIEDDINYGVKDTAYGLDAAAKAASQLVASGVKIGDEMKSTLRGISGVAAMTNSSYEEISHIFTTAAGQGKVMTMQLRELENRGLNAAATLAKSMGTSEAAVRDMVTKGKIDFKTFSDAMNEAFGDHAKDANKTFTGALANMKAALSRIGASFAAPTLNNLRDIFNELRNTFDNAHKALQPLIYVFEKLSNAITKSVVGSLKKFNTWFTDFGGKDKVIEAMNYALGALLHRLVPIKKAFESVFPKSAADNIDSIADAVVNFTKSLRPSEVELQALYYIFQGLFNAIKLIGNIIKTIAAGLAKFGPLLAPLTTLVTIVVLFGATIGKVAIKIISFANAIRSILPLLKVFGIVAAGALAVLAGVTVVKLIIANFDKIKAAFKMLGGSISNWFNDLKAKYPLLQKIADFFGSLGGKLKNVGSALAQFGKMAYSAFSQNGFIGGFKKLGEQLRETVNGINRVKKRSVEMADAYNLAAKRTGKAVSVTIDEEETAFQKFARILVTIGDKVKGFFEKLKTVLTIDNFMKGLHNIGEAFHNSFTKIGNTLQNSGVTAKLKAAGSAIVEFARNLDYGKIAAIGFATALISVIFKFGNLLGGVGTLTKEAGLFIRSLRKSLFNVTLIRTSPLNNLALALAVLAGSLTVLVTLYGNNPQALVNIAGILVGLGAGLLIFGTIAAKLGTFKTFSMTMLGLAAGIGILAASLLILDHVDFEHGLFEKVSALGGIALALAVAMRIIGKMDKSSVTNIFFAIAFAASVAILIKSLVKAFKELEGYGWEQMLPAAVGLGMVMSALSLLAFTMGKTKNFGSTLSILAFTAFIAVFANSLKKVMEAVTPEVLDSYLTVIDKYKEVVIGLGVLATVMLGVASMSGEGIQKLGTGILAMAAAIGLIAFVVVKMVEWTKTLTDADVGPVLAALGIISALIIVCGLFQKLSTRTQKLGQTIKQVNMGWTFLAMAAAILAMGQAVKMMAEVPIDKAKQCGIGLVIIGGIVAGMIGLSALTQKANPKGILSIAVLIGTLGTTLMVMSLLTWEEALPGMTALGVCLGVLAAIFYNMKNMKVNKNAFKTLIAVAILMGVLGAELIVLANLNWVRVAVSGAAMTAAMVALSKVIKAVSGSSGLGGKTADKKFKNLMAITMMLTAIGVSLVALSYQPWSSIAAAGAGMTAVMFMLTKLIRVISDSKGLGNASTYQNKMKMLREISIMMGAIGAALWIASSNHWSQIAAAGASMTAVMYILTKIIKVINETKPNEKATKQLLQVVGIMGLIGAEMAVLSHFDLVGMAVSAGLMLGVMSVLVLISSKIGNTKVKTSAVKQLAGLAAILIEIAIPIAILSKFDLVGMAASAAIMSAVIWELVAISKVMDKINPSIMDTASLAIAAASMVAIAIAMAIVGKTITDPGSMIAAAGALSIALVAIAVGLGLLTKLTGAIDLIATSAAIVIVAGACIALSVAIKMLEGVNWETFGMMAAAIGTIVGILFVVGIVLGALTEAAGIGAIAMVAMLALAGAFAIFANGVKMLGEAMLFAGNGLKIGAEGLQILVPVLDQLKDMDVKGMATALIELSKGLGVLALAGLGMIVGALGFAAFGLALQTGFVPGLLALAEVSTTQLEPLAANIRLITDALKPMQELGIGLIPVGIAFTLFGAALALAGYGINQGAAGLQVLAPALQQIMPLLTEEFVNQMITLAGGLTAIGGAGIILGMGAIGLNLGGSGLIVLAKGLEAMNQVSANAGSINDALEGLSSGLSAIGKAGMTLAFGAMGLIMGGAGLLILLPSLSQLSSGQINMETVGQQFETLAQGATSFAKAGMLLLVGAPGVLASAMAITSLGNALVGFQGKFTRALLTINETIKSVAKYTLETVKRDFLVVGTWIPESIIRGMAKGQSNLVSQGAKMAKALELSVRSNLQVFSPSPLFQGIGEWICKSLGIGIQRNADGTINAMATVTNAIKGKAAEAANAISNLMGLGNIFSTKATNVLSTAGAMDEKFGRVSESANYVDDVFKMLGIDTDDLTSGFKDMIPNMEDVTGGMGDMAGGAGKAKDSFSSLKDTIEQQMDIFSEFDTKTEITGEQMLNNMRSQVQGVAQWAANLQMLAARGIDQGLLAKLSELGPQGYEKVAAFVSMTDAQLQEANQLYATSLVLPSSAAAQITGSFASAGKNCTLGFLNNLDSTQIADGCMDAAIAGGNAYNDGWKTHSPSRVTEETAKNVVLGFTRGISNYQFLAVNIITGMTQKVITSLTNGLTPSKFEQIGKDAMTGLRNGIENNSGGVIDKMKSIANSIVTAAKEALKIESPSKVFYGLGRYIDLGLMRGISENAAEPINSIDDLTNQLTYKMGIMAATINDIIDENLDAQPTITPVLDLTNLQNGIGVASSLLASRSVRLSANQATIQSGSGTEIKANGSGNTVYEFTQNNYSPKALDRSEIYRQTRNQFSQIKQARV